MGKYHILTFGCQMNKSDSERIAGLLNSIGMSAAEDESHADILIANTCSVRQTAENRVYGKIKNWNEYRKNKPNLIIGVTGCMPGRDKNGKLQEKIKYADLFFAIDELPMLPKWIKELNKDLITGTPIRVEDYLDIKPEEKNKFSKFITIQTGCNNFCTYCVVPSARGRERNRKAKDILESIEKAVVQGTKEIILLGQVVNNYKYPDKPKERFFKNDFADLLYKINQIPGEFRVHFTAPDPQYFCDEQIEALKLPKQINHLHIPVQSGSNEILKKMNRKYTREYYIDLIKKIRKAVPEITIATDIIVGFCGETRDQFKNTLDLYKKCHFDISYHAVYSERSGTPAAKAFTDDVSQVEKKRRWRVIQDLMVEMTFKKNQKYKDQEVEVLVDKCEDGVCSGNSSEMKLTQFLGDKDLIGEIVNIKITQALTWVLKGKLVS